MKLVIKLCTTCICVQMHTIHFFFLWYLFLYINNLNSTKEKKNWCLILFFYSKTLFFFWPKKCLCNFLVLNFFFCTYYRGSFFSSPCFLFFTQSFMNQTLRQLHYSNTQQFVYIYHISCAYSTRILPFFLCILHFFFYLFCNKRSLIKKKKKIENTL
jgi:hypothetical protein